MKKILFLIYFLLSAFLVSGYIIRYEIPIYDVDQVLDYENFTENFTLAEGYYFEGNGSQLTSLTHSLQDAYDDGSVIIGNVNIIGTLNASLSAEDINRSLPTNCPTDNYQYGFGNNMSAILCRTDKTVNNTGFVNITELRVRNISSPYENRSFIFFQSDGSIGITLDPIEIIPSALAQEEIKPEITRTASTEIICNNENCYVLIYSGVRFVNEDNKWKDIKDAKSLKGIFNIKYLKNDGIHDFEIVDLNYTSIKLNVFVKDSKELNKDIPFKVDNVEKETKKLISLGEKLTVIFTSENILSSNYTFGSKSTTIILQDANTENLEDADVYENSADTNYGSSAWLIVKGNTPFQNYLYIKFNISSIPSAQQIDDAQLYLYHFLFGVAATYQISRVSNQSWTEDIITWNNAPPPATGLSNTTMTTDTGVWRIFDVTAGVSTDYDLNNVNTSFFIEDITLTTGSTRFHSKEAGDTTLRPYLNITYSPPPPPPPPPPKQFFVQNMSGDKQWWVNDEGDMWLKEDLNVSGLYYGNGSQLTGIRIGLDSAYTEGENVIDVDTDDVVWDLTSTQDFIVQDDGREVFKVDNTGDLYFGQASGDQILVKTDTTSSSPAYSFDGDSNTGIHQASDRLRFSAAGTTQMEIGSTYMRMNSGGSESSPVIQMGQDVDSGFWKPGFDILAVSTGGIEFLRFTEATTDETVFNDASYDIDFRIETDTEEFMFYVDSGEKLINISGGYGDTGVTIYDDGNISMDGHLTVEGNFTGNQIYGETNVHPDGNITVVINTQNVHENITGFNINKTNGFIMQGDDSLIAQVSGRYTADFWLSTAGGTNRIYEACIAVNNEHVEPHAHRKQGAAGDIGSMSGGGIIELNEGDVINLQIRNADGTQNVDIFYAGMRFVRIGD